MCTRREGGGRENYDASNENIDQHTQTGRKCEGRRKYIARGGSMGRGRTLLGQSARTHKKQNRSEAKSEERAKTTSNIPVPSMNRCGEAKRGAHGHSGHCSHEQD